MDAQQFAYWLQGFAELNAGPPSAEQWQSIRDHLGLVFTKVTPPLDGDAIIKEGPDHKIRPKGSPAGVWPTGRMVSPRDLVTIC